MLEALLGSEVEEKVLMYLRCREEGYARQIGRFFGLSLAGVQKQLARLENGGIVYSRALGRTRVYAYDPRYPFLAELQALLDKALTFYPARDRAALLMDRRRPRKAGKPL
jgi:DNA-binding transcriptional ArsR family regulator